MISTVIINLTTLIIKYGVTRLHNIVQKTGHHVADPTPGEITPTWIFGDKFLKVLTQSLVLSTCKTNANWWHAFVYMGKTATILKKRIKMKNYKIGVTVFREKTMYSVFSVRVSSG